MSTIADLVIRLRAEDTASKTIESSSKKIGSTLGGLTKTAGIAAGAAGIGGLTFAVKTGIDEWKDSTKIQAQTEAALKSTGAAAGVTAGHISDLAGSLLKKSGVDDEAIQSGENLLLTFTNIRNEAGKGNDVFDQTTKTMLDMSVALGQDTKSSALQLGKALNDPVRGVTALQRVGVSFTAAQRDQIKAMVDSGHTMDAQKLILGELNKEFGGSAETVGKTLPGQLNIAKETFNNFAGEMVGKMIPAIQSTVGYVVDHWPEIRTAIESTWQSVKPLVDALIAIVKAVVATVQANWPTISVVLEHVADAVQAAIRTVTAALRLPIDLIHGDWKKAWDDVKQIVMGPINIVVDLLRAQVAVFIAVAGNIGSGIKNAITGALGGLRGWFANLWDDIRGGIRNAVASVSGAAASFGAGILNGIGEGLKSLGSSIVSWLVSPINAVIDRINGVHIHFGGVDTHIPGVGKVAAFDLSPFNLPHLAVGTNEVYSDGMAYLHRGEAVVPADVAGGGFGGGFGGGPASAPAGDIIMVVDGDAIGRVARRYLTRTGVHNAGLTFGTA